MVYYNNKSYGVFRRRWSQPKKNKPILSKAGSYTISAESGAYSITGTAASLEYNRKLSTDPGSYTISGTAASLEYNREVAANSGSYSIVGTDASLEYNRKIAATFGSYAVSGTTSNLEYHHKLSAESGSFVINGTDASLEKSILFSAESGTYNISGTAASLERHYTLAATPGGFVISGTTASLEKSSVVIASAGSYVINGTVANLEHHYKLSAASGSYIITGTAADLIYSQPGSFTLVADPGSFVITGTAANLEYNREVAANAGTYNITGTNANLEYNRKIAANSGSFVISGTTANLEYNRLLSAVLGSYNVNGSAANLEYNRKLSASGGSYVISGMAANFVLGKTLIANSGSYIINGTAAALEYNRKLAASGGIYTISGTAANLSLSSANDYAELVLATQSADILGYYRLNESLGATIAVDSGPNNQDSVALAGNTFGTITNLGGGPNTGSTFPGGPSGYIQLEGNFNGGPLAAAEFSISCWFKMTSGSFGTAVSTGTGGVSAIPIVTKGRSEADSSGFNVNYFLGINGAGKLCGDFEATGGTNHPITGGTTLVQNRWYFGVLTYDRVNLRLYLNGVADATAIPNTDTPDVFTAQPACIGSAMDTSASPAGGFNGVIDEVCIWSTALSSAEILALWEVGRITDPMACIINGASILSATLSLQAGLFDIEDFIAESTRNKIFQSTRTGSKNFGVIHTGNKNFSIRK